MLDDLRHEYPSQVLLDLAPSLNALNSFLTIADAKQSPGISDWSIETREKLTEEEWGQHQIISNWIGAEALGNLIQSDAAYTSFPKFIEELAAMDAEALRNELLYWIVKRPAHRLNYKPLRDVENHMVLLESWENFWAFHDYPDVDEEYRLVERQVFDYLLNPPALQTLITNCLDRFWNEYFNIEWEINLPRLEAALTKFRQIDVSGMSHFEVIEAITHRNLRGTYRPEVLQNFSTLRFIPSPHSGPYILKTSNGEELRISFGAHHVLAHTGGADVMSSARVVEQMKALADENRIEIIQLLKIKGELGTQEIIDHLDLSKSAASRHLRQLFATSIVEVRVDEDGLSKYYRLNPAVAERLQTMLGDLLN